MKLLCLLVNVVTLLGNIESMALIRVLDLQTRQPYHIPTFHHFFQENEHHDEKYRNLFNGIRHSMSMSINHTPTPPPKRAPTANDDVVLTHSTAPTSERTC